MKRDLGQDKPELLYKEDGTINFKKGMIEALFETVKFRNKELGEHIIWIHNITQYMLTNTELGEGLSKEMIDLLSLAAGMHDVGKIAIPDGILNKHGELTPEEYEVMKTHTVLGIELLERIPQMKYHEVYVYAYDIIRHHHERWDGNGYPDGLKGDEISIWAQIVSIVDVYDSLVSKRVYKNAYEYDTAVQMIQEGQCGVFNPKLLECFMSVEGNIRKIYQE